MVFDIKNSILYEFYLYSHFWCMHSYIYTVYVHIHTQVYCTKMILYIMHISTHSCVYTYLYRSPYIHVPPYPPHTQFPQPMACMRGCSIGNRIFELETGNIYEHIHNWIFILWCVWYEFFGNTHNWVNCKFCKLAHTSKLWHHYGLVHSNFLFWAQLLVVRICT